MGSKPSLLVRGGSGVHAEGGEWGREREASTFEWPCYRP
jgi:hypothetical protein